MIFTILLKYCFIIILYVVFNLLMQNKLHLKTQFQQRNSLNWLKPVQNVNKFVEFVKTSVNYFAKRWYTITYVRGPFYKMQY